MRNKIKAQLKGVGLVMVIAGMVFAGLGLRAESRQADLDMYGVTVPAEITQAAIRSGTKSSRRCILSVQWGELQARETQKFEVKKEYYLTLVDGEGKVIAPNTTIRYIPGRPGTALLEGSSYPMGGFLGVGYGFLVFGAVLIVLGFVLSAAPTQNE